MSDEHNHQKKVAVISDLSGFGRCALAVSLPLISRLGVQCCPLPTAVFSNHTGFPSFYFEDRTDGIEPTIREWKKLDLRFSAILTGFLGSFRQIGLAEAFLDAFQDENTRVVIDPVMGDRGKLYATYTPEMAKEMKKLACRAHVLTPNLTEACILTDRPYSEQLTNAELTAMAEELCSQGPDAVVFTGIQRGPYLENFCWVKGSGASIVRTRKVEPQRSGTGDVFSSIVAAGAAQGISLTNSVRTAARFIRRCLIRSSELQIPETDGVCFEELLGSLHFEKE